MKKVICTALVWGLLLSFTGCGQIIPSDPTTEPPSTQGTTVPVPVTEPTVATTEATQPTSVETQPQESYLLTVTNHDTWIFDTPSYDGRYLDTVREAGVYTIVEVATDDEGHQWGRLKSGAGWIDLDQVEQDNGAQLMMSAAFLAEEPDIPYLEANYPTGLSNPVVLHAYTNLTNVRLYSLEWDGEAYAPSEPMYVAEQLDSQTPIVAYLEFYGDMTMYGVSFQDASGTFHHYRIATNGRNSALNFDPYQPN